MAQLAGEDFDETGFDNIGAFDKNRSGTVTLKEFVPVMRDLCASLPGNRADIVEDLATKASEYINEMRREVGREIRQFFSALDLDKDGALQQDDITKMANLAMALQRELKLDIDTKVPLEEYLSLEAFDKAKDGVVSQSEFIEHFLAFTKKLKIPKRELVSKLRQLVAEASGTWTPADMDQVMREVSGVRSVLDKYR